MKKLLLILLLLPTLAFSKTIELNENNTINFNQDFNAMFVAKKQVEAITKCARNLGSNIYVTLYTPGGSITAGKLFFDTLNALPCKFHTITIFSASMGYQTVQNLGKRYIIPSGTLMSHRASIRGLGGEIGGELDQVYNSIKKEVEEMEITAANRVGITLKDYKNLISDELWLTAKDAVKTNHADEVVLVKCDKSLMGTSVQTVRTFFGSFDVEYSDCPIVTAPIRVEVSNQEEETQLRDHLTNILKRIKFTL